MANASAGKLSPLSPKAPHFPAKAKRVIFLCMHVCSFACGYL